jgi:hypothetical protein
VDCRCTQWKAFSAAHIAARTLRCYWMSPTVLPVLVPLMPVKAADPLHILFA